MLFKTKEIYIFLETFFFVFFFFACWLLEGLPGYFGGRMNIFRLTFFFVNFLCFFFHEKMQVVFFFFCFKDDMRMRTSLFFGGLEELVWYGWKKWTNSSSIFMYVHMKMSPKFKLYYAVMLLMFCRLDVCACMMLSKTTSSSNKQAAATTTKNCQKKRGLLDGWMACCCYCLLLLLLS